MGQHLAVEAHTVGQLDLFQRILEQAVLGALLAPRTGVLVFVEDAEAQGHRNFLKPVARAADVELVEPARVISAAVRPPPEREGDALLRVAAAAAGTHEIEEVLEVAAEEALTAVNAASLSVSRWEREQNVLRTIINVGDLGPGEERYPTDETYPLGNDSAGGRLLHEGLAYFNAVDDPDLEPGCAARLERLGKESDVGVPILVEDVTWGEVYATTAPGQPRFRSEDVRFLEAVAGQLALAIGRAELFMRVSRLAYEDPLTGLANRRALEERLERAVIRAAERGGDLAVLLCDVDELKAINDAAGHAAGDRALRHVGEALVAAAATRPGSLVGRLAGDEFCIVIEGGTLANARALAADTLQALSSPGENILVSFGAAAHGEAVSTPASLVRAADAALYRAKRNGGGQIFTAGSHAPTPTARADRRALRRNPPDRVRDAIHELGARFDGDLAGEGALERIEAVAMALSEALDAAAWAISCVPAGGDTIHTVSLADDRDQRLQGLRLERGVDAYSLADYPATARLVHTGAGAFVTRVDDEGGDRAERALLEDYGRDCVLVAAAADFTFTWVLEIYADERSDSFEEAVLECGLLMRSALPPRPAERAGATLLARRSRQVALTSTLAARLTDATRDGAMLSATAEELYAAMGVSAAGVMQLRSYTGRGSFRVLDMTAGFGLFAEEAFVGFEQPADRGLVGRCLRERRAVLVGDVTAEPDYFSTPTTRRVWSELDVPIEIDGRPWGAITVQDCSPGAFDEVDAQLLVAVARQLAGALRA
jgi:diguanylate cyclase (GGDEF)-like protein